VDDDQTRGLLGLEVRRDRGAKWKEGAKITDGRN